MPLMPKRVKYRKQQRGKNRGLATAGQSLAFGEYGLQSMTREPITNIQDVTYTDLATAERDVFLRRWHDLGGPDIGASAGRP